MFAIANWHFLCAQWEGEGDSVPEAAAAQLRLHVQAQQEPRDWAGGAQKIREREQPPEIREQRWTRELRQGQAVQQVLQQVRRQLVNSYLCL